MKRIPFGFKFYIICILSFLIANLWGTMSVPSGKTISPQISIFSNALVTLFHCIAGSVYYMGLGKILKSNIRKIPYIIYKILGVFAVFMVFTSIYDIFDILSSGINIPASYVRKSIKLTFVIPLAIALLPPFSYYWWEWLKGHPWYRQFVEGLGGSSQWGTIFSFLRHPARLNRPLLSFPETHDEGVTSPYIFMGRTLLRHDPFTRLVGINDDSHFITIASTRSGKSVCSIYINAATYPGDMVIIDPKGEHAKTSFYRRCSTDFLKEQGIDDSDICKHFEHAESYVLDPFGITGKKSFQYNPLSEIDINDPNCREIITAIADGCVMPESGKDKHFEEMTRSVLQGLISYVLGRFPNESRKHNLPYISNLLYGINEDGFADSDVFNELLIDMLTCDAAGGLPQQAASELMKMGDKERGAVLSTVSRSVKWVGDPALRKHLTRSDFSFSEIGTKMVTTETGKTYKVIQTVYIVLPDTRMDDLNRWIRTLAAVGTVAMRRRPFLPELATLWIMDEFALLGNIKTISDGYGLLAGYKIKMWIFLQNLGQLKHDYPERWSAMIGNANTQVFGLTMTDPETPKFVSEVLGKNNIVRTEGQGELPFSLVRRKIVNESPKELLTASEVANLIGKSSNKQIVFPANDGYPMLLERLAFKPIKVGGQWLKGLPLDGLRGHIKD